MIFWPVELDMLDREALSTFADPGPEPDPLACDCSAVAGARPYTETVRHCAWYRHHERSVYDPTTGTVNAPLEASLRRHLRTALTFQASGYKGTQAPRVVDKARTERDRLAGNP